MKIKAVLIKKNRTWLFRRSPIPMPSILSWFKFHCQPMYSMAGLLNGVYLNINQRPVFLVTKRNHRIEFNQRQVLAFYVKVKIILILFEINLNRDWNSTTNTVTLNHHAMLQVTWLFLISRTPFSRIWWQKVGTW